MPPKTIVSPRAWGRPRTFWGPTFTLTVAVTDSPAWSVTVTLTTKLPLEDGVHERVVALVERQPPGRLSYEYDKAPPPPLVETASTTFSPESRLVGEAVKDVIARAELTVMLVVSLLEV